MDVLIVGAGPAGLSAALVLGRSCRKVRVFDDSRPRNESSLAVHGFLTRDGTPPAELARIARHQLEPYDVELSSVKVKDIQRIAGGFEAQLANGDRACGRKVLLATGVRDCLPEIDGLEARWGRSVFQCPYCHGWEHRNRPLAAYGWGRSGLDFALALTTWSHDVTLFTDGARAPLVDDARRMQRLGLRICADRLTRLEGEDCTLERVVLESGEAISVNALFLHAGQVQRTHLAARLGCEIQPRGTVVTGHHERTRVPGVYVAGDVAGDVQFAIVAAAEGAQAAYAINRELRLEETA